MPLFGAAYAPNKGITILYWFGSPKTLLNPPANGKIQGLFKAFEYFSSTFQGKFKFQGFLKTVLYIQVLYIQVLFTPVRTLDIKCESSAEIFFFNEIKNQEGYHSLCHLLQSQFRSLRISKLFLPGSTKPADQEQGKI